MALQWGKQTEMIILTGAVWAKSAEQKIDALMTSVRQYLYIHHDI